MEAPFLRHWKVMVRAWPVFTVAVSFTVEPTATTDLEAVMAVTTGGVTTWICAFLDTTLDTSLLTVT